MAQDGKRLECCNEFARKMALPENADEPIFTVRAQDKLSRSVLHFWIMRLVDEGGDPEKVAKGVAHLRAIEAWQKANPDRVKIPD